MKGFIKFFHISKCQISARTSSKYSGHIIQLHGLNRCPQRGCRSYFPYKIQSHSQKEPKEITKSQTKLMTQTKALKKAIAISGREINNNKLVWIWKGKNNITFYFLLSTGHYRQRFRKPDSGKSSYTLQTSASSRISPTNSGWGLKCRE